MIPDTVPSWAIEPTAWLVLSLVMYGLLRWQRTLTYHEYTAIHRVKRRALPLIDRLSRPIIRGVRRQSPALGSVARFTIPHLIHEKGDRSDDEYVATLDFDRRAVWRSFVGRGWSPHVLSSVKRRSVDAEIQLSALHFVYQHDDGTQTEVYSFPNPDGSIDLYAHHETSVVDPQGHLTDPQRDGDPRDVIPHPFTPGYTDNSGGGDGVE
ncbi:hypothetical protein OSG_eHP18_00040 [environmental Halophage eHP-18]|nr:hypothetical protein OSG_eHP18_00040 [environmental Halophage eHP-18]